MTAAADQLLCHIGMEAFDRRVVPTCGIDSVIVDWEVKGSLTAMVHHTKAQSILFGQWGFEKLHRSSIGLTALFVGPPGTGK